MSTNPYEQILADLKARRDQIDTDIASMEALRDRWGATSGTTPSSPTNSTGNIPSNAFFRMSIADAAIKLLGMAQQRLTINQIIDGLEKGGLPRSSYNSVYSILNRRAEANGDLEKLGSEWGLAEWSGPGRKRKPVSLNPKDFIMDETPDATDPAQPLDPTPVDEKGP